MQTSLLTACVLATALLLERTSFSAEIARRPNILVIITDDLNDWVGCLRGHPQVKTPNIDSLAKRGMLFTNAHVQATFCGPSRVSFLSGRMPQTTGCRNFERYESLDTRPPPDCTVALIPPVSGG